LPGQTTRQPQQVISNEAKAESLFTEDERLLLFTTATCPNCKIAKAFLNEAEIPFEVVKVEDNLELVSAYGIKSAPTLVVQTGTKYTLYVNASNIRLARTLEHF